MRTITMRTSLAAAGLALAAPLPSHAVGARPAAPEAAASARRDDELPLQRRAERGTVSAVTLYPDRAAVTRTLRLELPAGLWAVSVTDLPRSVLPQSLQAKAAPAAGTAGSVRILGLEYAETPRVEFASSPEGAALANAVRDMKRSLERLAEDRALLDAHDALVGQVGVRPTAADGPAGAVEPIDLAAAARQLEAVRAEQALIQGVSREMDARKEKLERELAVAEQRLAASGGADRVERAGIVTLGVPEACVVELALTYLVRDAAWAPSYAVRATADRSAVTVEYDAMVLQRTGEDWKDVRLSLSTAQPTRASSPPSVDPWFVDVVVPPPPVTGAPAEGGAAGGRMYKSDAPAPMAMADAAPGSPAAGTGGETAEMARALEELSAGASVNQGGVAVTFELPRPVTLPSDAQRRQRTRIGDFAPNARFTYVAAPVVSDAVFLRGTLGNSSAFQLLPGAAQVFMGGEFIGDAEMPSVAPGGEFRVYFGPDRTVRAKREVVSRLTGTSGLFGGSTVTTWNDRITIDNGTGRAIDVEVYDRRPASRNERIEVRLASATPALSADASYVESRMPQGILRWDLKVPAGARDAKAAKVEWTVELVRPNGLVTTPVPD
jgi:uncharacterized protein (TIGR02231 family)